MLHTVQVLPCVPFHMMSRGKRQPAADLWPTTHAVKREAWLWAWQRLSPKCKWHSSAPQCACGFSTLTVCLLAAIWGPTQQAQSSSQHRPSTSSRCRQRLATPPSLVVSMLLLLCMIG